MGKIEVFNMEGICQEKTCSSKYTHEVMINVMGFVTHALYCEKHYNEILDKFLNAEGRLVCQH